MPDHIELEVNNRKPSEDIPIFENKIIYFWIIHDSKRNQEKLECILNWIKIKTQCINTCRMPRRSQINDHAVNLLGRAY